MEDVAAGASPQASIRDNLGQFKKQFNETKLPFFVAMTEAGIEFANQEFGEKSLDMVEIVSKLEAPEIVFDAAETTKRARLDQVEAYVNQTSALETETSARRIGNIFKREAIAGLTPQEVARRILRAGLASADPRINSKARSTMLARTYNIWAYNEGAILSYAAHGVGSVEWLVTNDDKLCQFCMTMEIETNQGNKGREVGTGNAFAKRGSLQGVDGGTLRLPFNVTHPPLHPNCRCTVVPVL